MNETLNSALDAIASFGKGVWAASIVPIAITFWAIYRDVVSQNSIRQKNALLRREALKQEGDKQTADISARHLDYVRRIECDFQEIHKQIQETETEITVLRREKWQAELSVRAWRHACRDAQQIVWALQRQGCAAGSELTRFEPVDTTALLSVARQDRVPD